MSTGPSLSDFFVTQYYEFSFNRRPDTLGLYTWTSAVDNGASLQQIASSFVNGAEFKVLYGTLSNAQFVSTLQSNWGGHFSGTDINSWIGQLNAGTIDRGTVLYQMVGVAGMPDASARLTFFGDSGTARGNGHQYYYDNGGAAQHAMGAAFRLDGAFYKVTDIAELGDCAYAAGSSTTYDESVGADYNQYMFPYPSPYYLKDPYLVSKDYFNSTLQTSLNKQYPSINLAVVGNKVWPFNIYNFPLGFPNPETGGQGGSPDGLNHFWPTPGNHDYGARVGYTDTNSTAANGDTAYPAGMTSTGVPAPYIDYFGFLRNTSLLGTQAKSISIGNVDPTGNKGIYYSVRLGDQGNGKPLIELFSIDTERLNSNAGINDEFSDGYNGDNGQTVDKANYFYDPTLPYNAANPNTVAYLTNDPANGQAQYNWLKAGLQQSEAKWKILFGHQPIYSTGKMGNALGSDHGSNPVLQNMLKQLTTNAGTTFDAWINGHTHYYERVMEQNNNGIGQGIPFITNGNSGRSLYSTYQVDYGQSLYAPRNIDQKAYLNGLTNLLNSDPVMAGVSAELENFTVTNTGGVTKIKGDGTKLPGTYGQGYGAVATAAGSSYLFFDYVQTDVLDPAILANLNPDTRNKLLSGWDGLVAADWHPRSPTNADTANLKLTVAMDGSINKVTVSNPGAGYMSAHGGNAIVDFEIRGNDALDPANIANPNNYAIVQLTFKNGQLESAALKDGSHGSGYMYAAQSSIGSKLKSYATLAPTVELLNSAPLDLPINLSIFSGDDLMKSDSQYEDWYLITETKANFALKRGGAISATVVMTPESKAAEDIIKTHDLTTGYSGVGQQQKFSFAQNGKITISDSKSGAVLGSGTLVDGVTNFNLSGLPESGAFKVSFNGDPSSSYQINFKSSITQVALDTVSPFLVKASDSAFLTALYASSLNREADPIGIGAWEAALAMGTSRKTVVQSFFSGQEYSNMHRLNNDFVASLYSDLLGRSPDPAGLHNWSKQLDAGLDRAQLVGSFINSAEFSHFFS